MSLMSPELAGEIFTTSTTCEAQYNTLVLAQSLSRVQLLATSWTAAYQAPLSMGFSRQEYWNGLPLPSPIEGNSECQRK